MTAETSPALQTALAYHRAWTGGDFEQAMAHIADDVVCRAPAGTIEGADAFRGFMGPFAGMLVRAELVAAFGDERTALLMYDTQTALVADAPGAECLTVVDGKITELRIIFDRLPFEAARRAATGG
jgi:ketosteroid isomerase-like protein